MGKSRRLFVPVLVLAAVAGTGWWYRVPLAGWVARQPIFGPVISSVSPVLPRPGPDPVVYNNLSTSLERLRVELAGRYRAARTPKERAALENEARDLLEHALPAMMRCWLGTPWDFNGTAKGPGQGKIACGYFVATVLKDAGFQVNRYQLAQQPSGNILQSFVPKSSCVLTVGKPYDSFASEMEKREPGTYVVGLDSHVAFLVVTAESFRFIHSSGAEPWCVVDEGRDEAAVLQRSNWRIIGNLTADSGVLRRWLLAEKITVKGA